MTTASGQSQIPSGLPDQGDRPPAGGAWPTVVVPPDLHLAAAARLVGDAGGGDPTVAAQRFLQSAGALGVDLSLMWCTMDASPRRVRQACLAVVGAGRTAMLFISGPERRSGWGPARFRTPPVSHGHAERVALINHACVQVAIPGPAAGAGARLAQALLETREGEAAKAYRGAGFTQLGDLAYMRRPLRRASLIRELAGLPAPTWPAGVQVRTLDQMANAGLPSAEIDAQLVTALERSYEQTRDCPELCGLRHVNDVLESHRNVGVYDPALWWLVSDEDGPQGCMLLTVCPEQDSVELVYIGLSPKVRGHGLGARLMSLGLKALHDLVLSPAAPPGHTRVGGSGGLTCAVDTRNEPAMKLYRRLGFERFGVRAPLVRGLQPVL